MSKKIALAVAATTALAHLAAFASVGCTSHTDENYCADQCACENLEGDGACLKACRDDLATLKSRATEVGCLDAYNTARDCVDAQTSCVENRFLLADGACSIEQPNLTNCLNGISNGGSGSSTSTGK